MAKKGRNHDHQPRFQPEPVCTCHRPQQQPPSDEEASKLLGAINHLDSIDPETRSKLYERAVDAVFAAEENAFDKAAEMQAAITTDELTHKDD